MKSFLFPSIQHLNGTECNRCTPHSVYIVEAKEKKKTRKQISKRTKRRERKEKAARRTRFNAAGSFANPSDYTGLAYTRGSVPRTRATKSSKERGVYRSRACVHKRTGKYRRAASGWLFARCNFSSMARSAPASIPLELAAKGGIRDSCEYRRERGGNCRSNYCNEMFGVKRRRRQTRRGNWTSCLSQLCFRDIPGSTLKEKPELETLFVLAVDLRTVHLPFPGRILGKYGKIQISLAEYLKKFEGRNHPAEFSNFV